MMIEEFVFAYLNSNNSKSFEFQLFKMKNPISNTEVRIYELP